MHANIASTSLRLGCDQARRAGSRRLRADRFSVLALALASLAAAPMPAPETPGTKFQPPERPPAVGGPLVFEHSGEAGPDETFFLVGEGLSTNLFAWGLSAQSPLGQEWRPRMQFLANTYLAATLPEGAPDGPFIIWIKNQAGWSTPLALNTPQPWWCGPNIASPGTEVRVFGRSLSRRPDFSRAFVYLCQKDKPGIWPEVIRAGKYALTLRLPPGLPPGNYEVWVHAGAGGEFGWGGPVPLRVVPAPRRSSLSAVSSSVGAPVKELKAGATGAEIQKALEELAAQGGGTVRLAAASFQFSGTLRIPARVTLAGTGREHSTLQLVHDSTAAFARWHNSGWNQAPGGDHAAIWLAGDGAGLQDLTLLGDAQVNYGIAVASPLAVRWVTNCLVERVRVADCDGKQGENCGIFLRYAEHARLRDNELWGRAPLFISGARQSEFTGNRLVSVTRFGGNAEAAILGRNETIEECVIEGNLIATPPGAEAGGPTARRLLWFSTGHGSVTHNWIANNGVEKPNGPGAGVGAGQARFGGVAGTDQNVGEMILFEGNHRTAYFGPLADADSAGVTLPKTLVPTPDNRLGSVRRQELAHDAAGNETPFWPPDLDDGGDEPPVYEYYVSIFSGRGQGQTRRVLGRSGQRLLLVHPWTVPPQAGSVVVVGTAFYRNLIVGNYTPDGMTGIQLWISCVENVIAGNTIARQRKPGLFLYANGTTLASSMPRAWNRGISPLFWNLCEGNRIEECSAGALVTSGDENNLPIEFPRALGTVLRHNSFIRSRSDGVVLTSRPAPVGVKDSAASVTGTIVEFNVVRDAQIAYHAAHSCDAVVFRRNQAYFWYPVSPSPEPPTAFQVDEEGTTFSIEANSIEGLQGADDGRVQDLKTPAGVKRLPE
jgi:hypothetical protein